jgi:hypothetical protein
VNTTLRAAFATHAWWLLVLGLALRALPAQAQQLLVVDSTYTATTQNTTQSHFRINTLAAVPTNWRMPVDYSTGTLNVRVEVFEKPSDAKTLIAICLEGSTKICSPYPPAYTAPGVYNFSFPLDMFWQYAMLDWSMGIKELAVVLKTEAEVEAQGDPLFYPTKMRVTVNVVPQGQNSAGPGPDEDAGVTPRDAGAMPPKTDAGRPDAGPVDAGPADAGARLADAATRDAAVAPADAAIKPPTAASSSANGAGTLAASTNTAGSSAAGSDAGAAHHVSDYLTSDTGCSTTRPGTASADISGWFALGLICTASVRRSRRKGPA